MRNAVTLPTPKQFSDLMAAMLFKNVTAVAAKTPVPGNPRIVAAYYDGQGIPVALCVFDLTAGACLGAALTGMPPRAAAEEVAKKQLSEVLADNIHEVANILAQLFRPSSGIRVSLKKTYLPGEALDAEINAALTTNSGTLSITVTVAGYQPGQVTLINC